MPSTTPLKRPQYEMDEKSGIPFLSYTVGQPHATRGKAAVAPGLGYSPSLFDKSIYLRGINLRKMVLLVNVHIHKLKHYLDSHPSYPLPTVHSWQITIKRETARLCPCVLVTDGEK